MAKELERLGIPTAQICTMTKVAIGMGSNRVVPARSVLCPVGEPGSAPAEELKLRHQLVKLALDAVQTDVAEPTVMEANLLRK